MSKIIINPYDIKILREKDQIPIKKYFANNSCFQEQIGKYVIEFSGQRYLTEKQIKTLKNTRKNQVLKSLIDKLKSQEIPKETMKNLIFNNSF